MTSYPTGGFFEKIRRFLAENGESDLLSDVFKARCDSNELTLMTRLMVDSEVDAEHADAIIKGCLKTITMKGIERQIEQAGNAGDEKLLFLLFGKKKILQKAAEDPADGK